MTKNITIRAKVINISYKCTSYFGNPSYWVSFQANDGTIIHAYTANNAACGYGCQNFKNRECEITYHYTRNNNAIIDYMRK